MLSPGRPPLPYRETALCNRVYRTVQPGVPLKEREGQRPGQYKLYDVGKLERACADVQKGMSLRRAELEYGIPKSTIHGYASGNQMIGTTGHRRYLSDEEEYELVRFLIGCANVGYARSRKQIIATVESYLLNIKGVQVTLTNGWWEKFQKRHPVLTVRTAERLAYCRSIAADPGILNSYLEMLKRILDEYNILNVAPQIFNCDESGFPLDYKPLKVAARRGCKHPTTVISGDKGQITVLACASAAGITIPPMVIFDRKTLKQELTHGEVPGTMYGLTDNGWSNAELFNIWFHNHFLCHAPAVRPLLLLLDGHSSHYNPSTLKMAAKESVIIFCLPPHTTHIANPLDVSGFSALKTAWHQNCHEYTVEHFGKKVTRFQFSQLFSKAWFKAMTPTNIIAGFRACGVCPLDPSVFEVPTKDEDADNSASSEYGLPFIPFLTPVKKVAAKEKVTKEEDVDDRCESTSDIVHTYQKQSSLLKFFHVPPPPSRSVPSKLPTSKCLTSVENLHAIEEKEHQKREKERQKKERQLLREERREQKAIEKKAKASSKYTQLWPMIEDVLNNSH